MNQQEDNLKIQLDLLAKAGGKLQSDDDIEFSGKKFNIPQFYDPNMRQAGEYLIERADKENEYQSFSRSYKYKAWDGARATAVAFRRLFGSFDQKTSLFKMAETRTVPIGVGETMEVPWGEFEVPGMDKVTFSTTSNGGMFTLNAVGPRHWRHHITGVFEMVQSILDTDSIYRGRAFDGQDMPDFVDLSSLDRSKIVFNESVENLLEADLWSVIQYHKELREHGQPLKRVVLLQGPYGTGKTSAGFITAQVAVANNWTFIYVRPGRDDMEQAFKFAHTLQPCVVFVEDVDIIGDASQGAKKITKMLDLFDGIESKTKDVILVATTNHVSKLHKGMLRPGRIDSVIEIGALDDPATIKMIKAICGPNLADVVNWDRVVMAMQGFYPAFIKEALDRATRYSIVRNRGKVGKLTTDDFVNAALGLRPQLELMDAANDEPEKTTIDSLLRGLFADTAGISVAAAAATSEVVKAKIDRGTSEVVGRIQSSLTEAINATEIVDSDGDNVDDRYMKVPE